MGHPFPYAVQNLPGVLSDMEGSHASSGKISDMHEYSYENGKMCITSDTLVLNKHSTLN